MMPVRALVREFVEQIIELAGPFTVSEGHRMKLQELAEDLEQIKRGIVDGAASPGAIDGLAWLLNDAIHDAGELLSTFQSQAHNANSTLRKCCLVAAGASTSLNKLKKLLDDLPKLLRSLQELHGASQHGGMSRPVTNPRPAKGTLFGYTKEYAALVSSLVSAGCGGTHRGADTQVVAIIGHGGMGKTELARMVFSHDDEVRANFDLFIWVSVYGKFSEADLLRAIWKSVAGADAVVDGMNISSLEHKLAETVRSAKRYLLVLDDVCNDELAASHLCKVNAWRRVLAPFKQHGDRAGRVLITTRSAICSRTLNAGTSIVLNGISADAATLLLKKTVFGDEYASIPGDLQQVLHNNVGKLLGSPMAAEEVGCILKGKHDCRYWKEILNRYQHHRTHLSSYHDLPPHLKRCLAFCSIFPRRWEFEPEKLARMWVAHGFVKDSDPYKRNSWEEDVAREYFDALLQRSLFQEADHKGKDRYVIHEHIHSMLRQVAPQYYLSIDDPHEAVKIPSTVRHLSVTTDCLHQLAAYPPDWLKKLRTLLVCKQQYPNDCCASSTSQQASTSDVIDKRVLRRFRGVRVMDFSDTGMTEVPESIGELSNLRYLGLPNTIRELGAHVTKLVLLQTLSVVGNKCMFRKVPRDMRNLIKLRHLDMDGECIAQIAGIGAMEKLQGSIEFHAGGRAKGHDMGQLKRLNSLRRTLSIKGLEKVKTKQEAERAQLAEKRHLEALMLEWEHRSAQQAQISAVSDWQVLDGLRPHPNLQKLQITRYEGTASPGWLADAGALQNLRSLCLRKCWQLQALPPVGELPRLELLFIEDLRSVVSIDSTKFCSRGAPFRSLKMMVLKDMQNLAAWDAEAAPAGDGTGTPMLFPQLAKVEILNCPKLRSFSGLLYCRTSLSYLRVDGCPAVTAPFSRSDFPLLTQKNLHIHGCPNLSQFMV
ncbi:hypothetical protein ACP70R_030796 [Stipagrostis hirtigluma subsp. patula]